MAHLDAKNVACGYANYSDTHVTFPPKGLLPLPGNNIEGPPDCDLWDEIFDAALLVNPAFNIYRIYDTVWNIQSTSTYQNAEVNLPRSSLSCGTYWVSRKSVSPIMVISDQLLIVTSSGSFEQIQVSPLYFDREDVKKAINAPTNVDWSECSNVRVFPHGDASLPPAFTVLPNVIEKSERAVIVHGLADYILIAEG